MIAESQVSRRNFLRAAPVAGIAAMAGGVATAEATGLSPLRDLYRQWREAKAAFAAAAAADEDDDALYWHAVSFEERAAAYVPQTLDDMLMKIVFADDDGAMCNTVFQVALAAQARTLAGIKASNQSSEAL